MPIRFRCDACGQFLGISRRRAGDVVRCPLCGADTQVPQAQTQPEVAPQPSVPRSAALSIAVDEAEGGLRLRKAETSFEDMDLTPMVDVVFQLLIFFMLTASFATLRGLEVPSSDPNQKGARQSIPREELESRSIMVYIDERGTVSIDDQPVGDLVRLEDLLRDRMRAERKNEMVIEADDRATHGVVVAVKDAATGAGMERIRLARIREGGNR